MQSISKVILIISSVLFTQWLYAAQCQYQIIDEWNAGYKAEITIINQDAALSDWTLSWPLTAGASFNSGWNATFSCAAGTCTATPPAWNPVIHTGARYTFGFIANKEGNPADQTVTIQGEVCAQVSENTGNALWQLDGSRSSVQYVSMKQDHTAEVATFLGTEAEPALSSTISESGAVVFALDLNKVSTGVELRDTRLLALLFETDLLPTAYFRSQLDSVELANMQTGSFRTESLNGDISLHGVRQSISADVIIAKISDTELSVSTIKPLLIDSKNFDLSAGIEALRLVANLQTIGESVPLYFHLQYHAVNDASTPTEFMPTAPSDPSLLNADFDVNSAEAQLGWQDNSDNESRFLVRRKALDGHWQTIADLAPNTSNLSEALPDSGEFDYKVIALNNSVPSLPTNVERISVTEGNQLVRGQQDYQLHCAACHGARGEGVSSFPALNTERDKNDMIAYIVANMPPANPGACDQQCAEDIVTFIETLWVADAVCDPVLTPVSYGARQLKILTHAEYQHSVEDLLGVDYDAATGLSADTQIGLFTNNTFASMVPTSYSNFLLVAEAIAQWSANRNFSPALDCAAFDSTCAEQMMNTLAPKIFRRPLTVDENSAYQLMATGAYSEGDIKSGIQMTIEAMLASPQFLYRHELGEANPGNPELDGDGFELTSYEMATFLAYTFTGSTPDQTLQDAAARDELRSETAIMAHAQRLAGNATPVMGRFVGAWLGTADLDKAAKDPALWPDFQLMVPHMQNEINTTFSHIMLQPDEQFASLYAGQYTFLNDTLATHYGIGGVSGDGLQQINTPNRGGILANGAFMARWGEAVETSPILRSVRVRRRMLCQDQPEPPAGTFAAREGKLAELSELLQDPTTTNRVKYHRLTEDSPCTNCHTQYINPLGFGMEDFDTVGRNRAVDLNGNTIDTTGELYAPLSYSDLDDVIAFNGVQDLGMVLAELPSAQSCLPKQLFRYLIGVGDQEIDSANPDGPQLSEEEKSGYACELDKLTDTMMNTSPREMLERFGSLQAVRYRKAWLRD